MQTHSLAPNLVLRRHRIEVAFPRVVTYWQPDTAHLQRESDHNYDARGMGHALDVMLRGIKARSVLTWALAHPHDLEYVICQGFIYSRIRDFAKHPYDGTDPHTDHIHLSGRHGTVGWNTMTGTGYSTDAEQDTTFGHLVP